MQLSPLKTAIFCPSSDSHLIIMGGIPERGNQTLEQSTDTVYLFDVKKQKAEWLAKSLSARFICIPYQYIVTKKRELFALVATE